MPFVKRHNNYYSLLNWYFYSASIILFFLKEKKNLSFRFIHSTRSHSIPIPLKYNCPNSTFCISSGLFLARILGPSIITRTIPHFLFLTLLKWPWRLVSFSQCLSHIYKFKKQKKKLTYIQAINAIAENVYLFIFFFYIYIIYIIKIHAIYIFFLSLTWCHIFIKVCNKL